MGGLKDEPSVLNTLMVAGCCGFTLSLRCMDGFLYLEIGGCNLVPVMWNWALVEGLPDPPSAGSQISLNLTEFVVKCTTTSTPTTSN